MATTAGPVDERHPTCPDPSLTTKDQGPVEVSTQQQPRMDGFEMPCRGDPCVIKKVRTGGIVPYQRGLCWDSYVMNNEWNDTGPEGWGLAGSWGRGSPGLLCALLLLPLGAQ